MSDTPTRYDCDNCDFSTENRSDLPTVKHMYARVEPGEIYPAGECPKCGALVHIHKDQEVPL